jgi:O-succinylbenzoic acid--CoA ligase
VVPEVVAIDLPPGRGFVDALRAVWDTGDAAAPLDPRLPPAAARELLAAIAPTRIVGADGAIVRLDGGLPAAPGDALVLATSGSGGRPRGVVLTHSAVAASARLTSARLGVDPSSHRWLCCLPVAHVGGLSVITRALLTDTPLEVLPRFDADDVVASARAGVTHVSMVSTALRRVSPSLFHTVLLGGAAPPSSELAPNVVVTYGLTESGSGVVYDGVALDGVSVALDPSSGEIVLRGPTLLRAYRDGTSAFVAGPDGAGGWFPTGDAGRIDAVGRLVVEGRMAEVIVTGGEKVWPDRVESALRLDPSVDEVGVWKRPDDEYGERVVAWVVPADPADPPTLPALRDRVSSVLPRWAAPRELVLTTSLPRTASGKVRRRALA